jgi:hypothetical protein
MADGGIAGIHQLDKNAQMIAMYCAVRGDIISRCDTGIYEIACLIKKNCRKLA